MTPELIADVALRATIQKGESAVFSYRVPARLRGLAQPGQLVWAPLRRQRVQGVILSVYRPENAADSAPSASLRELIDLADPEATLTPDGLRLADWVAETYRVPLYEALALLLPPGVSQEADVTWRATPTGISVDLGALPERERAILYYLRMHGEMTERDLRRELRGSDTDLRDAYASLHERGLLMRGAALSAPRARPRLERLARLLVSPDSIETTLTDLNRAPKQQAVIRWLTEHDVDPALAAAQLDEAIGAPSMHAPQSVPNETNGASAAYPVQEIYSATGANATLLRVLEEKGLIALESRQVRRDPLAGDGVPPDQPPPLSNGQRQVWEPIVVALDQFGPWSKEQGATPNNATPAPDDAVQASSSKPQTHKIFLLHGVTGSGKTEIYLRSIARALRLGRQALVLVPEIALTAQLVRRFAARFPGQLAVLHSGLSLGERYDEWRRLRRGVARLAIGSRSAVFAPLPELGLIIIDEEHEPTYKHDGSPRYHARDAARRLAELTSSVLILGSATPSVESYYAAQTGRYTLLAMPERVGSTLGADGRLRTRTLTLPAVRLVDMRRELQSGNRSIFSQPLQNALAGALERGEQAILFLNRRGAASFVMCRDCGHVITCPACSGPLVLHYDKEPTEDQANAAHNPQNTLLICHACNYHAIVPTICPQCLSPRIKAFGVGTQRVEEEVRRLFPAARPLRWDRDSVKGKGAHGRMLDQFLRHEADILVGTQMIAKGLDLPLVSVVGVVAADTSLHLPDFRSGERTFQLITQVAGRAGRRNAGAQVLIQTYTPEHYALLTAQEHDYHAFYIQEIAFRRQTGYPPFGRLVRFVYASGSEAACQRATAELAERVRTLAERMRLDDWGLIGPAPAFLSRIRGRWRWHLLLRVHDPLPILTALGPLTGWMVDVDPAHVL
jgi:primosomal protein N' (replication factor Y)